MCVTTSTKNFCSMHSETVISMLLNISIDCLVKTGPAGSGFKLCLGTKNRQIAADTFVDTFLFIIEQQTAEGRFGPFPARDSVFFRRQLCLPLCIGFTNFFHT